MDDWEDDFLEHSFYNNWQPERKECGQELCVFWNGYGCPCKMMGIPPQKVDELDDWTENDRM